jgi:glycosyltransferase involved in cell wall biosynthesis
MSNPTVSVIVPCYNASQTIESTLESVFAQQGVEIETIVVDDGSTDKSADLIAARFPQVRLERTPNNGPSAARNLGTTFAKAPFIQYLDADDLLVLDKIAVQLEALERTGADVAYGDWIRVEVEPDCVHRREERISRTLGSDPDIDLFTDFWCPPAVYLIRRKIVEKVGAWPQQLVVGEDARFMLDCALHGARFVRCEGVMGYYRILDSGSLSRNASTRFLRDCLTNAEEVHAWWLNRGVFNEKRRRAVASIYGQVARGAVNKDSQTSARAQELLQEVMPGYVPEYPWRMRIAAHIIGYSRAITLAGQLQQWRNSLVGRRQQ